MLLRIHVRDYVIVEDLEIELDGGMTVLTGETGAGKSLLVDALQLVTGARASATLVRGDAPRAEVSATFENNVRTRAWLEANALDEDDEHSCLLRRVLGRDGRSRAYINGRTVSLSQLRELGELLVDVHAQHAHQSLLRRDAQRELLDAFADAGKLVNVVADCFEHVKTLQNERESLLTGAETLEQRLDFLRYQFEELDTIGLSEGEAERLEQELKRLTHADEVLGEGRRLFDALSEDDQSITTLLAQARNRLQTLASFEPKLGTVVDLLEQARINLDEATGALRDVLDSVEHNEARQAEVEARLAQIHDLARKHRVHTNSLHERHATLAAELQSLEQSSSRLTQIENDLRKANTVYLHKARELSKVRSEAAQALADRVSKRLSTLGMSGAQLFVAVRPADPPRVTRHGIDDVELMVATNPGQPPQPISRVASGGELSRIALAIQVVAVHASSVPTLVFDEVDVGVGGKTAEVVGRNLRALAQSRQVLCVTHLPQVASQAHHQLRVHKQSESSASRSVLETLSQESRVNELARMLAGEEITNEALAHARDLLTRAAKSG